MVIDEHLETTVKAHDQLLHRRVDLLLRTGKLLVESLADTNRIVRNMKRTAAYLGIPEEKLQCQLHYADGERERWRLFVYEIPAY